MKCRSGHNTISNDKLIFPCEPFSEWPRVFFLCLPYGSSFPDLLTSRWYDTVEEVVPCTEDTCEDSTAGAFVNPCSSHMWVIQGKRFGSRVLSIPPLLRKWSSEPLQERGSAHTAPFDPHGEFVRRSSCLILSVAHDIKAGELTQRIGFAGADDSNCAH